jgi:hypothetical protein
VQLRGLGSGSVDRSATVVTIHSTGTADSSGETRDTTAINQLVSDFYQVISAPSGCKLDRRRLESLFVQQGVIRKTLDL